MAAVKALNQYPANDSDRMWIKGTCRLRRAFRERDTNRIAEYVVVLPRLVVTCHLSRSHLPDSPYIANGWHPPSDRKSTW